MVHQHVKLHLASAQGDFAKWGKNAHREYMDQPGYYGYLRYQASTYVNCLYVKVQKKLAPEDT